jgi:hypothetical protein
LVLLVSTPVAQVPLVATKPLQPPEAVHSVALSAFHDSVELLPLVTVAGVAVSLTVGAATVTTSADCEAEPPGPVQVNM